MENQSSGYDVCDRYMLHIPFPGGTCPVLLDAHSFTYAVYTAALLSGKKKTLVSVHYILYIFPPGNEYHT